MAEDKSKKADEKMIAVQYHMHQPCHFTHNGKDYSLYKGSTVTVPDTQFVQALKAQGRVTVNK